MTGGTIAMLLVLLIIIVAVVDITLQKMNNRDYEDSKHKADREYQKLIERLF